MFGFGLGYVGGGGLGGALGGSCNCCCGGGWEDGHCCGSCYCIGNYEDLEVFPLQLNGWLGWVHQ